MHFGIFLALFLIYLPFGGLLVSFIDDDIKDQMIGRIRGFCRCLCWGMFILIAFGWIFALFNLFNNIHVLSTSFDSVPASYQYLVPFELMGKEVLYMEDESFVTFMPGGTSDRPNSEMSIVRADKEACQFFYDCPASTKPYVVIHAIEIEREYRFWFVYWPLENETKFQYDLHLHPQQAAGS